MTGPVEGYNMNIFEHEDGTVSYTGSFNAAEWDAYHAKKGDKAQADSAADDAVEQPAGNGPVQEWRAYAVTQGATEDEVAGMSRKDLRDKYGTKPEEA